MVKDLVENSRELETRARGMIASCFILEICQEAKSDPLDSLFQSKLESFSFVNAFKIVAK